MMCNLIVGQVCALRGVPIEHGSGANGEIVAQRVALSCAIISQLYNHATSLSHRSLSQF